jgi:hypothetical protein
MKRNKWFIALFLLFLIALAEAFLTTDLPTPAEKPLINHVKEIERKTSLLRDSIVKYKSEVKSLEKAKKRVKIVPFSVLVKDTIGLDSNCNNVAKRLLNEIVKRDSIIKIDSLLQISQAKQISRYEKIDSFAVKTIEVVQLERDSIKQSSDKRIKKAERKSKMICVGVGILGVIVIFLGLL